MNIDVFESNRRPQGRYGAVFERNDETAYFYLLDLQRPADRQIVGAYDVPAITKMPTAVKVRIAWTPEGDLAGLMIHGQLLAVFDIPAVPEEKWEGRDALPGERSRFLDS